MTARPSLIDSTIGEAADKRRVIRRVVGTRDTSGRLTPDPAPLAALVRLRVQSRDTTLVRDVDGDTTDGEVDIWAPLADLALAEDELNLGVPLNWTALQIAPTEFVQGPPGDRVEWKGRVYEITSEAPHDGEGPLIGGFRGYVGTERGAA